MPPADVFRVLRPGGTLLLTAPGVWVAHEVPRDFWRFTRWGLEALAREAANLARKGKPFRKLRTFADWNFEELPELAPAHSVAFWREVSQEVSPGGIGLDLGVALTREEARSLSLGDLLGVFRDLAPLYKLLANA